MGTGRKNSHLDREIQDNGCAFQRLGGSISNGMLPSRTGADDHVVVVHDLVLLRSLRTEPELALPCETTTEPHSPSEQHFCFVFFGKNNISAMRERNFSDAISIWVIQEAIVGRSANRRRRG